MKKRILSALCALVLLFSCLVMPASAESSLTTDFSRLLIRDVMEGPYTLDNPPTDVTVLVVGRVICGRTLRAASETLALFEEMNIENGRIILLDIDQEEDTVREYALSNPGISAAWCGGTSDYQKLFWEIYRATPSASSDGSAVSLPSVCALDASLEPIYFSSNNTFTKADMAEALAPYAAPLPEPGPVFSDVSDSDWFSEAVFYMNERGFMSGTSDTAFSPQLSTTRAMVVTILHRMAGSPAAPAAIFSDVPPRQWYSGAISWAAYTGIVSGYGDNSFGPDDTITREQMAAILHRFASLQGNVLDIQVFLDRFTDAPQISPYAVDAMVWAVASGLITGTSDTQLSPQGSATRAQVATILMRLCNHMGL